MELTYTIYANVTVMPSRAYILKNSPKTIELFDEPEIYANELSLSEFNSEILFKIYHPSDYYDFTLKFLRNKKLISVKNFIQILEKNCIYGKTFSGYMSQIEETNFTKFALGLYPIYENTRTQFHLLTSENYFHCNTLSNRFCYYLIPTYGYEQTEELIISISTSDDTPVTSAFIEVFIYNYEHGDFFINTKSTKKWKTMISQIKGNTNRWRIYHVLGLEEAILSK